MSSLKTIRKSKYPKAADFLLVLLNHSVKYSLPEYSLFESGRAIPTKSNAITICKCLECSLADVNEFTVFTSESTVYDKPAAIPRMIPGRDISFDDLPEGNLKRSAGRWSDMNWNDMQHELHRHGYKDVKQYLALTLLGVSNLKNRGK